MNMHKQKQQIFFFFHQKKFRFQDFLYQALYKDDSQLCC